MFGKLIKGLLPQKQDKAVSYKNRDLYKGLCDIFKENLNDESFGEMMLYPTSFNIILHPVDFDERELAFPLVVQEVVNAFYNIIKENSSVFRVYTPPSNYWFFSFAKAESFELNEDNLITINRGFPFISAELYRVNVNNRYATANTKVTLNKIYTDPYASTNINPDVFNNLDVLAKGVFQIKFDNSLQSLRETPVSQAGKVFADLSYNNGLKGIEHFIMIDDEITISGKNDNRDGSQIMKIDSDAIGIDLVKIKYVSSEKCFYIAAFDKIRVNERSFEISKDGNVDWKKLPKKSNILILDMLVVRFESNL